MILFAPTYRRPRLVKGAIDVEMEAIALLQTCVHVLKGGLVSIARLLCVR